MQICDHTRVSWKCTRIGKGRKGSTAGTTFLRGDQVQGTTKRLSDHLGVVKCSVRLVPFYHRLPNRQA